MIPANRLIVIAEMIIFLLLPNKILNKILVYFNEEHKKEFYTQKRLFNTLDMRIQKINDFNNIIKQLSDMIVSNVNFKYKMLDKKYILKFLLKVFVVNVIMLIYVGKIK